MTGVSQPPPHTTEQFTLRHVPHLAFRKRLSGGDNKTWLRRESASEADPCCEPLDNPQSSSQPYHVEDMDSRPTQSPIMPDDEPSTTQLSSQSRRISATSELVSEYIQSSNQDTKSKKRSSLFRLLSLKEPSTSAFEDFARQQQKQAASREGRVTGVGMSGTSSQKLPSSVPKVNSKWDGLPSPVRNKASATRNLHRESVFSVATRDSRSSSSHMSSQASFSSSDGYRIPTPPVPSIASTAGSGKERSNSLQSSPLRPDETAQRYVYRVSPPPALFPVPPLPTPALTSPSILSSQIHLANQGYSTDIGVKVESASRDELSLKKGDDAGCHDHELLKYDYMRVQSLPAWPNDPDDILVRNSGPGVLAPPAKSRSRYSRNASTTQKSHESGSPVESHEQNPKSILKQKPRDVQPDLYAGDTSDGADNPVTPLVMFMTSEGTAGPRIVDPLGITPRPFGSRQGVDRDRPRTAIIDVLPWESIDASAPGEAFGPTHREGEKQKKRGLFSRRIPR